MSETLREIRDHLVEAEERRIVALDQVRLELELYRKLVTRLYRTTA
jgi:hypothetical protein